MFKTIHLSVFGYCVLIYALALSATAAGFVKETGMGHIGVAYPQSAMAATFNPACVVEVGDRIDLAFGTVIVNGHVTISDSQVPTFNQKASTSQCKYLPANVFGNTKRITPNLSVGFNGDIGITSSVGTISHTLEPFGEGPLSFSNLIAIPQFTLAYKLNSQHSFGITVPINLSRVKVNGLQNLAAFSLYPDSVSNKGYSWAYGVALKFGWLYHITHDFNFGISYTTGLLASSRHHKYKGILPSKGKFQNAAELATGFAYNYGRGTVGLQMHYYFFSPFNTLHNSSNSTAPLGSKKGPGPGFKDMIFWEFGADYNVTCNLTARAGYVYINPKFVRRDNVNLDFIQPVLLSIANLFTGGASYKFKTFELSFCYLLSPPRKVKGPPSPSLAGGHIKASTGAIHTILFNVGKEF